MPQALRAASPRIAEIVPADAIAEVRSQLTAIARRQEASAGYSGDLAAVWQELGITLSGGKLVRPAILLAVAATAREGVPAPEEPWMAQTVADLAVAVELLHHAFLLHDDVIDRDTLRRGRPNLIAVLGARMAGPSGDARRVGEAASILAGDLVLAQAHQLLARLNAPAEVRGRLLDVLAETLDHSVAGELADVRYAAGGRRPALSEVLAMSERKTGAYTVRLPLLWALIATGAPIPGQLEEYARALGLAFQLQDDLLGAFGDPRLVGKDPASDVREGKFTALMAHASLTPAWPQIEPHLGDARLSKAQAGRVLALLEECGARTAVESALAAALQLARERAAETGPIAGVLGLLVAALAERTS